MARNIEIKAYAANIKVQEELAARIATTQAKTLDQHDIFYKVQNGRLKLRIIDGHGQLIAYHRPDQAGPKSSEYQIYHTDNPWSLHTALTATHSILGEVKKRRNLYLQGRTRIHMDQVEGLGNFIELEVVLNEAEPVEAGEQIARDLMVALDIADSDLIEKAYIDLILAS